MSRVWNFSAGPAVLPAEVLEQVKDEMLDWHGAGCGVMEMSHRGKEFTSIIEAAEADLRELMGIPANYRVLFLQGGATQQFAQLPMNLLAGSGEKKSADYLITGSWSKKAYKEAQRVTAGIASVRNAGTTEASGFTRFLDTSEIDLDPNAAYVHLCTNETIHGVELDCSRLPVTKVPLMADMSSHILSRPVDISKYGMIYAGAQKNIGPSGVTLVIIRDDLLGRASANIPSVMDYGVMAENDSMLNTPPTFAIYVSGLIFKRLKQLGGLAEMEKINRHKAELLYACIDNSEGFYRNSVRVEDRSRMNVPFTLANSDLDAVFLAESKAAGLVSLKGHKSVGGMRASIYNAMPLDGVRILAEFMDDFRKRNA